MDKLNEPIHGPAEPTQFAVADTAIRQCLNPCQTARSTEIRSPASGSSLPQPALASHHQIRSGVHRSDHYRQRSKEELTA